MLKKQTIAHEFKSEAGGKFAARRNPARTLPRRQPVRALQRSYMAIYEPAEEGGYIVTFPEGSAPRLPPIAADGWASDDRRRGAGGARKNQALNSMAVGRVVVPFHPSDLKRGLVFKIIRDSGMTIEEFRKFL